MIQICYASRTVRPLTRAEYGDLAGQARRHNGRDAITGLLLYDGARFVQALEGPAALAEACMARIERDARHQDVSVVERGPVTERQFGGFALAALMPDEGDPSAFVEQVKALVADVASPKLRAVFIGFAMLSRPR